MPSHSIAQRKSAGIARAVEKGELPKSKLKGASKRMFQSMRGKGELHKFATTKEKGLPQHVKQEGLTARQMFEREHLSEGRDDAPRLGLGKTGLKFARMQSKQAFKTTGGTDEKWRTSAALRSELAGEKPGAQMKSMDKVGPVRKAMKGLGDSVTPQQVVDKLLAD